MLQAISYKLARAGERLPEKRARELMEVIISRTEENSYQVGGSYSGVNDEDISDEFPILEEEEQKL